MSDDPDDDGSVIRRERFSGGPARSFLSSLAGDERIFAADIAVDRAHVVMLAEQRIVGEDDAGAILSALAEIEDAGHSALPDGEDVHEAIEAAVIDRVGPDGGRMHTARSRNDEVATCIRYRLREDVLGSLSALIGLRGALLEAAQAHTETVMPGYTHLQSAQPTTVAHWLLSYEAAVERDTERLLSAYERINRSPLGAGAFAGTTFDIDRGRTAELLGFDGVMGNSMDAVSARDFLVETVGALATCAVTLSGLAEDLVIFANRGFVDVADDYASTSSIMPQKKNPDTLELTRGVAGDAVGDLTALLTTLKGLPRAYNRDLQRAGPHAWDAIDAVLEAIKVGGGAVDTAQWNNAALSAAAGEGFSTATGVADLLAQAGVPFRQAHEVVATAAGAANGTPTTEQLNEASESVLGDSLWAFLEEEAVAAALDPVQSVASRDSEGGPAPVATADAIQTAEATLDADLPVISELSAALNEAESELAAEVATYE
jgi:argininosuccinate lyase